MESAGIIAGIALGCVASIPPLIALRPGTPKRMSRALVAVLAPFALIQAVLLALGLLAPQLAEPVGIAASLSYLCIVLIATLRTANRR